MTRISNARADTRPAAWLHSFRVSRSAASPAAPGYGRTGTTIFTAPILVAGKFVSMSPRWEHDPDIRRGRSVVCHLHVHLVFVTRYRRDVLDGEMLTRCGRIMRDVCAPLAIIKEYIEQQKQSA